VKLSEGLIRIADQRDSLPSLGLIYASGYEAARQDQAVVESAAVN
jgi:hypothetical protein